LAITQKLISERVRSISDTIPLEGWYRSAT
jgi:hypothetical protein